MTKREYLQQYQLIQQEIQRLLIEQHHWEELACRVTPVIHEQTAVAIPAPPIPISLTLALQNSPCPVPVSRMLQANRLDQVRENIFLWEMRIAQEVEGLLSLRRAIDDAIRTVPDPESQLVLKYRYIDGLTMEEIASRMNYCERHISRLHESALRTICLSGCTDEPLKPHPAKSSSASCPPLKSRRAI